MSDHNTHTLTLQDLLPDAQFKKERPHLIKEILSLKVERRMSFGPYATVLFENRRLIWWQIQEMVRVEKGGQEQAKGELSVYNPLIPSRFRLALTLMIEISDSVLRKKTLALLSGFEEYLHLVFGGHRVPARTVHAHGDQDTEREVGQEPTSSVHFLSFTLDENQRCDFAQSRPSLVCDHPSYKHKEALSDALWQHLKGDLQLVEGA